ncbi:MAG TPA: ATP-binding cassette domain-containing protein, partial [Spirochaetia bacterium]|nr:ATP-binding cassette domain-containing protein [Spirochaetia bacterium]
MSESIVDIRDLSARFGDQQVLHGVNASVPAGQITVVLGASGSGKTTLLKHVLGLHRPTTGSVRLFDQELASISERELN